VPHEVLPYGFHSQMEARFFLIIPKIKKKFGLTYEQFIVIQSIHYLSSSNEKFPWCVASRQQIAKFCGISERTVFRAIQKGIELGLIVKDERTGFLRTTAKWHKALYIEDENGSETDNLAVQFGSHPDSLSYPPDSVSPHTDSLSYNNISDKVSDKVNSNIGTANLQTNRPYPTSTYYIPPAIKCSRCKQEITDHLRVLDRKPLCEKCYWEIARERASGVSKEEVLEKIRKTRASFGMLPHSIRSKAEEEVAKEERKSKRSVDNSKKPSKTNEKTKKNEGEEEISILDFQI